MADHQAGPGKPGGGNEPGAPPPQAGRIEGFAIGNFASPARAPASANPTPDQVASNDAKSKELVPVRENARQLVPLPAARHLVPILRAQADIERFHIDIDNLPVEFRPAARRSLEVTVGRYTTESKRNKNRSDTLKRLSVGGLTLSTAGVIGLAAGTMALATPFALGASALMLGGAAATTVLLGVGHWLENR